MKSSTQPGASSGACRRLFNSGRARRNGFEDSQLNTIQQRLKQASDARAQEKAGGKILYAGDADMTD